MRKYAWAGDDSTIDGAAKEVIFDMWNSGTLVDTGATPDGSYGRVTTYVQPGNADKVFFHIASGSNIITKTLNTGLTSSGYSTIADGQWHHYAITARSEGTIGGQSTFVNLYVDGKNTDTQYTSLGKASLSFVFDSDTHADDADASVIIIDNLDNEISYRIRNDGGALSHSAGVVQFRAGSTAAETAQNFVDAVNSNSKGHYYLYLSLIHI